MGPKETIIACGQLNESGIQVMNKESILAKAMMLKLLSGAVQMNHIKMTTWRKPVNFPIHSWCSWYGVVCHLKDQGKWKSLLSAIKVFVYIEILDNFLVLSLENVLIP